MEREIEKFVNLFGLIFEQTLFLKSLILLANLLTVCYMILKANVYMHLALTILCINITLTITH